MTTKKSLVVSPRVRVIRTAIQTLVAVCAAVPAAIALLPVKAEHAAWVTGIAGAAVIVVSAAQNAWEASTDRTLKPGDRGAVDTGALIWLVVGLLIGYVLCKVGVGGE